MFLKYQIDVNKQNKEELDNIKNQFNTLKTSIQSNNNSGSNGRYTDEKINRLDDKIYRLERNISDHDSRIRKLEMKVR
jgi:predicted RNase H-like nuclease (RuvC/YqgF family)